MATHSCRKTVTHQSNSWGCITTCIIICSFLSNYVGQCSFIVFIVAVKTSVVVINNSRVWLPVCDITKQTVNIKFGVANICVCRGFEFVFHCFTTFLFAVALFLLWNTSICSRKGALKRLKSKFLYVPSHQHIPNSVDVFYPPHPTNDV